MSKFGKFTGGSGNTQLPTQPKSRATPTVQSQPDIDAKLAVYMDKGRNLEASQRTAGIARRGGTYAIALDATGSMGGLIEAAKESISTIIQRVFKEASREIKIQLFIYRDYDVIEDILETSPLTNDPNVLLNWLSKINVFGGGGNEGEAIEKPLEAIFRAGDFSVVLLAGDEPPNNKSAKDRQVQTAFDWAKKFGEKQLPVHTFVIGSCEDTDRDFRKLAKMTGGKCGRLDGSSEMIDMAVMAFLTDLKGRQSVVDYMSKYSLSSNAKNFGTLLLEGPQR